MTSEEYDNLTEEEKRIKVAELCGWRQKPADSNGIVWWVHPTEGQYKNDSLITGVPFYITDIPNYLNDLNAMRQALKHLDGDNDPYSTYIDHLWIITGAATWFDIIEASAEDRAKAFVLTMTGG